MFVNQHVEGLLSDMIPAVFQFYCCYYKDFNEYQFPLAYVEANLAIKLDLYI